MSPYYLSKTYITYMYQGRIQDFKLGGAHLKICLGYFVWKITILHQKILFFPILEGVPPWIRPCVCLYVPSRSWFSFRM
jgi:hypothetical protein